MQELRQEKYHKFMMLLLFYGFLILGSCKKLDTSQEQNEAIGISYEGQFFNSHRTSDSKENAIVNFVKRINEKENFVNNAVKQIGFPRWNKTTSYASKYKSNSFTSSNDSTTTYYIPFVRDTQNFVNASLIIVANPSDTTFQFKYDWQYLQMQNSPNSVLDSAENFAVMFMRLDKAVFGYKKFSITDHNLFKRNNKNAIHVELLDSTIQNNLDEQATCVSLTITYNDCYAPNSDECSGGCDGCWWCTGAIHITSCTEGSGGGSSGGSGIPTGGGPTGNGGCSGCGGGGQQGTGGSSGGWVPVTMLLEPCDIITPLKNSTKYKEMFSKFKDSAADPTKLYELSASFSNVNQTNYNTASGVNQPEGHVNIVAQVGETLIGYIHTHYAGALPIFSVGDLGTIYTLVKNNSALASQITIGLATSQGNCYVLTINDLNKFMLFGNKYFINEEDFYDLEKKYDGYKIGRFSDNVKNEAAFLELLSDNNAGLTLIKLSSDLNSFSELTRASSTTVTATPCN